MNSYKVKTPYTTYLVSIRPNGIHSCTIALFSHLYDRNRLLQRPGVGDLRVLSVFLRGTGFKENNQEGIAIASHVTATLSLVENRLLRAMHGATVCLQFQDLQSVLSCLLHRRSETGIPFPFGIDGVSANACRLRRPHDVAGVSEDLKEAFCPI
jgi:hypothetical protein